MRAFHDSAVYKAAQGAIGKKEPPEALVLAVSALCDALYERAARTRDDSSEIGYWTDKLTIALVKLKRFDEALRWIRRFEDAPSAVRGNTAGGVSNVLKKRRARCEAIVERSPLKS